MNRLILATILLTFISCSEDGSGSLIQELDYPRTMTVFCQASLSDALKIVAYEYENDKVVKETSTQNGEVESQIIRQYTSNGKISYETSFYDRLKEEKDYVYNDKNQLINILFKVTEYDINGKIIDETERETPREYENNQLIKEWHYWGGFSTYEYSSGKLVTKIDHNISGQPHHITTYGYDADLLAEEKKVTNGGILMYLKTYEYNSENMIVQIREGQNVIEHNDYLNNKLVEKRTYYFGTTPGSQRCFGNFLYQYKY